MKIAFHLFGDNSVAFSRLVKVPFMIFGDSLPKFNPDMFGLIVDSQIPEPKGARAVQFLSNDTRVPDGYSFSIYYGDVRRWCEPKAIPVVCDIMDPHFWYYYRNLTRYGLFTFSVNTSVCDPDVFQQTVRVLGTESEILPYGGLL